MGRMLAQCVPPFVRDAVRCALRPEYRRERRLLRAVAKVPPRRRFSVPFLGSQLEVVDSRSFTPMYAEIFGREIYKFRTSVTDPVIIDAGANIGLGLIYLKRLYPAARVVAFEADPQIFEVLRLNVERFGLTDVTLHNKAVAGHDGRVRFVSEGTDSGRIAPDSKGEQTCDVEATRLRHFLQHDVHLLKMDIEGAETEVLLDCRDLLVNVENLFVEYHSFAGREQNLPELLALLKAAGFRLYIYSVADAWPTPLFERPGGWAMDLQLNIFGFRDSWRPRN